MGGTGEGITFDTALTDYVGQFGKGQLRILLVASLFRIPEACAFLLWVFTSTDPISSRRWVCNAGAADTACSAVFDSPDPATDFCQLSPDQWRWTQPHLSVVSEFNLVCDRSWMVQNTNMMLFIGCFIGSGLFGALCDVVGRKSPLFCATAVVAVATFASLAAANYWTFAALRLITGAAASGQTLTILLLSTEPCGPSRRGVVGIASMVFFTFGEFMLVAFANLLPHWRHLTIAVGCINAAGLLLYFNVPESARWLLSRGKYTEASQLVRDIAQANRTVVPPQPLVHQQQRQHPSHSQHQLHAPAVSIWRLLQHPDMRYQFITLACMWFTLLLVYFGIALGSGSLPGSL